VPGIVANGRLETTIGNFPAAGLAPGAAGIACIRPQHWTISGDPTAIAGTLLVAEFEGDGHRLLLQVDGIAGPVTVRVPVRNPAAPGSGDLMHLKIDTDRVPVVDAD
jgi:iron(III) transport system ATP-binding protein